MFHTRNEMLRKKYTFRMSYIFLSPLLLYDTFFVRRRKNRRIQHLFEELMVKETLYLQTYDISINNNFN